MSVTPDPESQALDQIIEIKQLEGKDYWFRHAGGLGMFRQDGTKYVYDELSEDEQYAYNAAKEFRHKVERLT